MVPEGDDVGILWTDEKPGAMMTLREEGYCHLCTCKLTFSLSMHYDAALLQAGRRICWDAAPIRTPQFVRLGRKDCLPFSRLTMLMEMFSGHIKASVLLPRFRHQWLMTLVVS
jgi:hypothetical protein